MDALLSPFMSYWISLNWSQVGAWGYLDMLDNGMHVCMYNTSRRARASRSHQRRLHPCRLQASFHAASPEALATLRLHLTSPLGHAAAAVLFRELDFAPVLAKVRQQCVRVRTAGV